MSYENVAIDYVGHVAVLKLNAPEVLNALSPPYGPGIVVCHHRYHPK